MGVGLDSLASSNSAHLQANTNFDPIRDCQVKKSHKACYDLRRVPLRCFRMRLVVWCQLNSWLFLALWWRNYQILVSSLYTDQISLKFSSKAKPILIERKCHLSILLTAVLISWFYCPQRFRVFVNGWHSLGQFFNLSLCEHLCWPIGQNVLTQSNV